MISVCLMILNQSRWRVALSVISGLDLSKFPFNYCRTFTASLKPVSPAVALHMVLAERTTFFLCHTYNYFSVHDTAGYCREAVKTMIQCKEFLTVVELIKQI